MSTDNQYVVFGGVAVPVGTGIMAAGQSAVILANGLNSNVQFGGQTSARVSGPTAAFSIGGLQPPGGASPSPGQEVTVINTTTQPMTIYHEDIASSSAFRIDTQVGVPVVIAPGRKSSARFTYDGTSSRWVLQNTGLQQVVHLNVKDFGALGNGRTTAADGSIQSGQTAFTSASAGSVGGPAFLPTDVGLPIVIPGAGDAGGVLRTTIAAYVSAGSVTLAAPASTTVTTSRAYWYHDDTSAIQSAVNAAIVYGFAGVAFPPSSGAYVCTGTITVSNSCMLIGMGGKVAGGISGGYTNAPALWHDFSGDWFVWNGSGGGSSAQWGVTTSGGGMRDLKLTQIYGSPGDSTSRGQAILVQATDSTHCPSWMQFEDLIIDEGYNSPWTWAITLDGSNAASIGGLSNFRISKVSSHTGSGASGALQVKCAGGLKLTDFEFHDVNGNISITGTDPGGGGCRSVGIVITGGDCVTLALDWASQISVSGTQATACTTTANTLGPNYFNFGQLATPFTDNSTGSGSAAFYQEPTAQVNPCLKATQPICLSAGEFYSCSHSQTGLSNLNVTGATNASPIVITTQGAHGLSTGAQVSIAGVLGNTAANGAHFVTVVDTTHFSLQGTTGNGAYTSGGVVKPTMCSLIGLASVGGVDRCQIVPNADIPITVSASGGSIGFLGAAPIARPAVSGCTQAGTGIPSLVTALANLGLVSDSTSSDQVSATGTSVSVANGVRVVLKTDNTSLNTLTGGVVGQVVTVIFQVLPATTSADRTGNFRLAGSANFTATQTWATLQLVYAGSSGLWCEVARSASNG